MTPENRAKLEAHVKEMQVRQQKAAPQNQWKHGSYVHFSTADGSATAYVDHNGAVSLLGDVGQEMAATMAALARELGKLDDDARERIVTLLEGLRDVKVEQILDVGNVGGWARVHARMRDYLDGDA